MYDDSELVIRLHKDDVRAFDLLYSKYYGALYAFILKYLKLPQLSEDILQEVFLKVWEVRKQIIPECSFQAYLYKIARNRVYKEFKKIAAEDEYLLLLAGRISQSAEEPEAKARWNEYQRIFESAVERLPAQRKRIFRLCRQEGRSYDEVASELHISRNTVKEHMVLGTKFIKEFIFQYYRIESLFILLAALVHLI
jgi:RNA polymerase sigma-70 factor (family 1)